MENKTSIDTLIDKYSEIAENAIQVKFDEKQKLVVRELMGSFAEFVSSQQFTYYCGVWYQLPKLQIRAIATEELINKFLNQ